MMSTPALSANSAAAIQLSSSIMYSELTSSDRNNQKLASGADPIRNPGIYPPITERTVLP